jgi:hypothetical protein
MKELLSLKVGYFCGIYQMYFLITLLFVTV